jgi:hypothetical protein
MTKPVADTRPYATFVFEHEGEQYVSLSDYERLRERVLSLETCERHLQSQLEWLRMELGPVCNRTYTPDSATVWPPNVQEFVRTGVMPTHYMRETK